MGFVITRKKHNQQTGYMTEFIFNDCGCCLNPDVRTVYKTKQYEVTVRTAYRDGYWYDGINVEYDSGGWSHTPCTKGNRERHATKEAAERYAISRVLQSVLESHNENFSAELVAALHREVSARQLSLF